MLKEPALNEPAPICFLFCKGCTFIIGCSIRSDRISNGKGKRESCSVVVTATDNECCILKRLFFVCTDLIGCAGKLLLSGVEYYGSVNCLVEVVASESVTATVVSKLNEIALEVVAVSCIGNSELFLGGVTNEHDLLTLDGYSEADVGTVGAVGIDIEGLKVLKCPEDLELCVTEVELLTGETV